LTSWIICDRNFISFSILSIYSLILSSICPGSKYCFNSIKFIAPGYFAPLLAKTPDPAALTQYLQPDGLHPSAQGVQVIVDGIGPFVLDLLKEIP
jgi:hypothetical protein